MSKTTYSASGKPDDKVLIWLKGEIQTPPFSVDARRETGALLRLLQQGISLSLPQSRPMGTIGTRCHELRIIDNDCTWRVIYRIEPDAVVILEVFKKKTEATPILVVRTCKARLARYLELIK